MKTISKMSLVLVPTMIFGLVACSGETVKPAAPVPVEEIAPPPEPVAAVPEEIEPAPVDRLNDPNSLLSKRTVYFNYNSSTINGDSIELIRAHAEYLATNGSRTFTLEGHTDERGSREYNMTLGEKRANAVRSLLLENGVTASQIQVISYGEERPIQSDHTSDAWSANRRAVFSYLTAN